MEKELYISKGKTVGELIEQLMSFDKNLTVVVLEDDIINEMVCFEVNEYNGKKYLEIY